MPKSAAKPIQKDVPSKRTTEIDAIFSAAKGKSKASPETSLTDQHSPSVSRARLADKPKRKKRETEVLLEDTSLHASSELKMPPSPEPQIVLDPSAKIEANALKSATAPLRKRTKTRTGSIEPKRGAIGKADLKFADSRGTAPRKVISKSAVSPY